MWVNPRDGEEVGRFMWDNYSLQEQNVVVGIHMSMSVTV